MFCSKCGNQMSEEAAFCSKCGFCLGGTNYTAQAEVPREREISGNFHEISSKVPIQLMPGEVLLEQHSAAFVMSSIAQGLFSLTNKRILFTKDSAGKSFLKRGGLIGMALNSGASIPEVISLEEITGIVPTSCIQGKAAMLITIRSGRQYKIALQSMSLGKTDELCSARDRVVNMIQSVL